jgi:small-conductance mechanosensitive channel
MVLLDTWGDMILPSQIFLIDEAWQLIVIAALLLLTSRGLRRPETPEQVEETSPRLWLKRNLSFIVTWALTIFATLICSITENGNSFFRFFAFLGGLWIAIGLICSCIADRFWARTAAFVLYSITALNAISYSKSSLDAIKNVQFNIGSLTISFADVAAGLLSFGVTLWLSLGIARLIEKQIKAQRRLSLSLQVLITKIIRIILILAATMIALSSMGIDLSSLTVLGGAVGLGLGFGLQKVVSNFVSGVILLLDNSIKPGDVIEIDGTYGWINNLRARYASVITRDGTEHLIPNEDLITQRVINWSFTDELVRIRAIVGVSYEADPHECIRLIIEAAKKNPRVLQDPKPICLLKEFGDSSINLELRFWLRDPANGIGSVKSDILLKIWDAFKEHNIEIPFPQRDLHIRSSDVDFVKREVPDPE